MDPAVPYTYLVVTPSLDDNQEKLLKTNELWAPNLDLSIPVSGASLSWAEQNRDPHVWHCSLEHFWLCIYCLNKSL